MMARFWVDSFLVALLLTGLPFALRAETLLVRTVNGQWLEGESPLKAIPITEAGGRVRNLAISQLLSAHSGAPASPTEEAAITEMLPRIAARDQKDSDRKKVDAAVEELSNIGLPVLTPLLKSYRDTDQHEPKPLFRLFPRIMPAEADGFDRTLGLLRLRDGQLLRGQLPTSGSFLLAGQSVPWAQVRLLAVRQRQVARRAVLHALYHCTQIEYWDSGIRPSAGSQLQLSATGFTRLSFGEDGWATDPNGLTKPGSPAYKSNLVDGHPFGALVGRIGTEMEPFFLGKSATRPLAGNGRLQFAINDNRHWQNNLGAYTVSVQVTQAYDLGTPLPGDGQ